VGTAKNKGLKIAVLGSGSGSNCQSIIDAIGDGSLNAEIVSVISDVEGATILERARRHGLPARYVSAAPFKTKLDGEAEQAYIRIMKDAGAEVVVLAGFMRIVKQGLLRAFNGRILNIHPSLLPSFPGLQAWKQALDYGVKVTGCTVHFVDEGTDTGPIIVQRSVPVMDDDTPETLHARIQEQEHLAYPEALRRLATGALLLTDGRRVRTRA
jgi:phosphoribosylglycinamide formyltransferase 1